MKGLLCRRLLPLFLGMLLCMPVVFAQNQISVKGKVLDADGQPVIGAAIMQKGTNNGVTTDMDGNFSFVVPSGAVLEISSIGYVTQEVNAASNLNVILNEESVELDETIVVGYGTQKKASL
ncbi:MAG: carboxypeptidase-like regulatory domain-containing protein, partial [Bacteroidia bacterium]|nr:carboxypeptidase-like regulatory domain-containing protein [Bacteroidia bacterium]